MAKVGFDDSKFVPYEQRPQEFHGTVVLERQPAQMPHPHPSQGGRLTPTRGVTHVMLANGYEFYECDYNCGRTAEAAVSIKSHLTAHNPAKTDPDYSPEVLEKIIRFARDERARGFRGYCERTAERLNSAGLTMLSGQPFNAENVSHLYNAHKDRFPDRPRRGRPPGSRNKPTADTTASKITEVAAAEPPKRGTTTQTVSSSALNELFVRAERELTRVRREADALESTLAEIHTAVVALSASTAPDPEIVHKARLYDEMRRKFMG